LRLSFWLADKTGLAGKENLIFMVFCLAIVIGMIVPPIILSLWNAGDNPLRTELAFRILVVSAIPLTLSGYLTRASVALGFQFFAVTAMAGAMNICLNQAAKGGVAPRCIGRFVGCYISAAGAFTIILFFLPGFPMPTSAILTVTCLFMAVAAVAFTARTPAGNGAENEISGITPAEMPRKIKVGTMCAIGLFVIIAGILDNIFFFESAFENIPYLTVVPCEFF
jgi:hypothetical protein